MQLGRLLDRLLVDFGSNLRGTLEPSWHPNLKNEVTKRCQNNKQNQEAQAGPGAPASRVGWSLKTIQTTFQTSPRGHSNTPLRALGARWRIYTYIYIYISAQRLSLKRAEFHL